MSLVNAAVDIDSLPRADEAPLHAIDPRYPRVVLGVTLAILIPIFLAVAVLVALVPPIPTLARAGIVMAVLALVAVVAWHSYRAARVIRYAVREHDVIVRSGVFWRKETVQPIKRIQHVEQVQGPLDKRLGLSTLRLYSAGTGHVTLQIPGVDAAVAARIAAFILDYTDQDDGAPSAPVPPPEGTSETADG